MDPIKSFENMTEEDFDKELGIQNASPAHLQKELLNYSKVSNKYYRWRAKAVKRVDELTLKKNITVAEIVEDLCREAEDRGKPYPPSSLESIRKIKAPLDPRYKKVMQKLNEAKETASMLDGLVRSHESRGYRLAELTDIMKRTMSPTEVIEKRKSLDDRLEDAGELLNV